MNDNYDEIEEEVKEKETEGKKAKHKVSGRSVFELQEIIKTRSQRLSDSDSGREKSEVKKEEENADSGETVAGK